MFVSLAFVLFLIAIWMLFAVVPRNWRKVVLLCASYTFCCYISVSAAIALAVSTVVAFYSSKIIEKTHNKKLARCITVLSTLLFAIVLVGVKYTPFLIVGFSFYAFQAIGYIFDVHNGKIKAEKDFIVFAIYMGLFAKLVSGPIERVEHFSEKVRGIVEVKVFDRERLSKALVYMMLGYFYKLVVADRLALIVNQIYDVPSYFDVIWLIGGAIMYSFQIYADFAGYTFIAIGCAYLFGLELTQNFVSPYCSVNITDFWRRWHISLSSWLRDYIYIPLGGNRKGIFRKNINVLIVFILCGIWHGKGLSFVVWGLLHGIYSIIDGIRKVKVGEQNRVVKELSVIITFLAVTFAWIFFRADTLGAALEYIRLMFTNGINPRGPVAFIESNGIVMIQVYLSILLIALIQIADRICYKKNLGLPEFILGQNRIIKYLFFYVCIMAIFIFGIYGSSFEAENFIYMQF